MKWPDACATGCALPLSAGFEVWREWMVRNVGDVESVNSRMKFAYPNGHKNLSQVNPENLRIALPYV